MIELYNEDGTKAGFNEVIAWWLEKYEGMEHLSAKPETWYAVNSILGKCFKKIVEKREIISGSHVSGVDEVEIPSTSFGGCAVTDSQKQPSPK